MLTRQSKRSIDTSSDLDDEAQHKQKKQQQAVQSSQSSPNLPKINLTIELPDGWTPEDTQFGTMRFDFLSPTSKSYREVEALFRNGIPVDTADILGISGVKNMTLYLSWMTRVAADRSRTQVPPRIQKLWHGTQVSNAANICTNNLDKGRITSNVGSIYGKGVYLTWSVRYASSDNYSKPAEHESTFHDSNGNSISLPMGTKCLILCKVIVGKTLPVSNNNHMLVAPPEGFDSTCNEALIDPNTGNTVLPEECVYSIFDTSRIYPENVIYFLPKREMEKVFKPLACNKIANSSCAASGQAPAASVRLNIATPSSSLQAAMGAAVSSTVTSGCSTSSSAHGGSLLGTVGLQSSSSTSQKASLYKT